MGVTWTSSIHSSGGLRGGCGAEGVGHLEPGVGHPGVVGTGDELRPGGGRDAVVQPADVRPVVGAQLVPPDPRDQHRPLLERLRPLHRVLLRGHRDAARRCRARARRGRHQRREDQQGGRLAGHVNEWLSCDRD
uniref:Uncharacterized protein n=1 Tax=Triticum urartu TaxID=4572 RepID=A0A8R7QUM7_TRIUA